MVLSTHLIEDVEPVWTKPSFEGGPGVAAVDGAGRQRERAWSTYFRRYSNAELLKYELEATCGYYGSAYLVLLASALLGLGPPHMPQAEMETVWR